MAYLTNPRLRTFADPTDDGGTDPSAPRARLSLAGASGATGGAPAVPDFGATPRQYTPAEVQDASRPFGTRLGSNLRRTRQAIGNAEVNLANRIVGRAADVTSALSYPGRALGGVVRDTYNAAAGQPESPNAGQPLPARTAPRLSLPYPDAAAAPGASTAPVGTTATVANDPRNYDPAADNISAANLAASATLGAQRLPDTTVRAPAEAAAAPVVDSGVTVGGRRLNYGAMVDGVPTFSDGSGGLNGAPGSIPRTVSDATLKRLAAAPSIGRADVGALGTPLASDVLGSTPTQDQQVARLVRGAAQPITGSRPSDADFARSDLLAIASGDPRSAVGTAARNLQLEASYGRTPRLRRAAADQLAGLQASTAQAAAIGQQQEGQQAITDQQGANALQAEDLRGQYQLANTRQAQLVRPGSPVTLADGTIALLDPTTGQVRPTTTASGAPARAPITRDDPATRRTNEIMDQLSKTAADLAKTALPPAGAPADWQPDPAEYRARAAQLQGLPVVTNSKTGQRAVNINGQWMPL